MCDRPVWVALTARKKIAPIICLNYMLTTNHFITLRTENEVLLSTAQQLNRKQPLESRNSNEISSTSHIQSALGKVNAPNMLNGLALKKFRWSTYIQQRKLSRIQKTFQRKESNSESGQFRKIPWRKIVLAVPEGMKIEQTAHRMASLITSNRSNLIDLLQ